MCLPRCVAIFYNLSWFCSIKVSNKKLQCNAENACGNRMCKRYSRTAVYDHYRQSKRSQTMPLEIEGRALVTTFE
jgi:hypothetical protein